MGSFIVDGHRWLDERLRFLHGQLERDDLVDADRGAIEAEIEQLSKEGPISVTPGGRLFRRLLAWVRRR